MKRNEIKTVEMTRRIRDAHYKQLRGKSWDEQVAFYREKARCLHDELKDEVKERAVQA